MANERLPQDGLEKLQSILEGLSDRQKDEMYTLLKKDKERRNINHPTAHLSHSIGHHFSIIKNNRPGITDEEALSIYAGYLIPRSSLVEDDDGNLKCKTFYYLKDREFLSKEVLPKMFPKEFEKNLQPDGINQKIPSEVLEELKKYLDLQPNGEVLHKNEHADNGYREIRAINPLTTIKTSSEGRKELKKYLDAQSDVE